MKPWCSLFYAACLHTLQGVHWDWLLLLHSAWHTLQPAATSTRQHFRNIGWDLQFIRAFAIHTFAVVKLHRRGVNKQYLTEFFMDHTLYFTILIIEKAIRSKTKKLKFFWICGQNFNSNCAWDGGDCKTELGPRPSYDLPFGAEHFCGYWYCIPQYVSLSMAELYWVTIISLIFVYKLCLWIIKYHRNYFNCTLMIFRVVCENLTGVGYRWYFLQ